MGVVNNTGSNAIEPLQGNPPEGTNGTFGVTGIIEFNDSAVLTVTPWQTISDIGTNTGFC